MRNQATIETNFSPVSHDKHRISISVLKIFANFLRVWETRRSKVVLLQKMDSYCQQQTEQTLAEYSVHLMAEEIVLPTAPVM